MSDAGPVQEGAGVQEDTLIGDVVEELPETTSAKLRRLCRAWSWITFIAVIAFLIVLVIALAFTIPCDKDLRIRLKNFTVRDMAVVHSNSTPWQVTSDIDLTLALQNPNAWVRPCDFSLREVELSVHYRDSLISFFDLSYLIRSLKPTSSHKVTTKLNGDRSQVSDEAGVALEAQLLRNDNVTLVLEINARYMLPGWNRLVNHKVCEVVAKTPQQGPRSGHRGFLSAECEEKVMEEV